MPRHDKLSAPPSDLTLVHATVPDSTTVLPDGCKGLVVQTAGPLNVVMQSGAVLGNVPFAAGFNPGEFTEVRDSTLLTSPASNVWAAT